MAQDPDQWTIADAVALRLFLGDNPKFLRVLGKRRPKIEGATMESRAVTGSDANGYLLALDEIESLMREGIESSDNAGFIADET